MWKLLRFRCRTFLDRKLEGVEAGWPAPWPAQAGLQAGRLWGVAGPLAGLPADKEFSPTGRILPSLFKGFLPQINITICQLLELSPLHC